MADRNYFIGLILLNVFYIGCAGSAMYLPLFHKQVLEFDNGRIGFISAIVPFTSIVGFPYWTSVADKTGAFKKIMIRNSLVSLMCTLSISIIPSISKSVFTRTVLVSLAYFATSFFGFSLLGVIDAVILHVLADKKAHFGKQKLGMPVGMAISTITTGLLIKSMGTLYALFIVNAGFSLSFIATVLYTNFEPRATYERTEDHKDDFDDRKTLPVAPTAYNEGEQLLDHRIAVKEIEDETQPLIAADKRAIMNSGDDEGAAQKKVSIWQLLESPAAVQFHTFMMLVGFSMGMILSFLFLFFEHDLHASPVLIGLLTPLAASVEIFCFSFSKEIFNLLGAAQMLIIGQCLIVIRCLIYTFCSKISYGLHLATAVQLLQGLGFSLTFCSAALQADHLAPPHLKSSVQGLLQMGMNGIGNGLGVLFGGLVYEHFGASSMFALNAMIAAVSIILYKSKMIRRVLFVPLARAIERILAK